MPATLTSGTWLARRKLWKIQIGSVLTPPARKIVTMTSSNDSANASRPPAISAERRAGKRHVAERLERVGAKVGRRLLERPRGPAQPGDRVVVDEHDAERRVADDDREEAERDVERGERRATAPCPSRSRAGRSARMTTNEIVSRPKNE